MDLRRLRQQHIESGKELNIDLNNSGSETRITEKSIPEFAYKKKKGRVEFNTPIQPVYRRDPTYNEDKKKYDDRFSKSGYNIG